MTLCDVVLAQAQFDASELITQREVVSQKVNDLLTERAKQFGLLLDDISIVSPRPVACILQWVIECYVISFRPI